MQNKSNLLIVAVGFILLGLLWQKVTKLTDYVIPIANENARISLSYAALTGTKCFDCHSPQGTMLPVRRSLNQNAFISWVRGEVRSVGYVDCPTLDKATISDVDLFRIYSILYKK
jgi:hypothetical protein